MPQGPVATLESWHHACVQQDDGIGSGVQALRGVSAANGLAIGGFVVALAFWRLSAGHRWTLWPLLGVLVTAAVVTDLLVQRRRARQFTLSVAVADAAVATSALGAGLLLAAGGWFIAAGAATVAVLQFCWVGRARALRGHWDAPLALTGLIAVLTYASAQRPWSPSSGEWVVVTTVAACGAVVGSWATVQSLRRRAFGTAKR